jgi:hypothetical protein
MRYLFIMLSTIAGGLLVWGLLTGQPKAAEKPFNVYQAGPNCVYMVGEVGRAVAITALPGPCQ